MTSVCVCTLACGRPDYYLAARQAALSVLERTPFDVFVVHGGHGPLRLPATSRLSQQAIPEPPAERLRSGPFLAKFEALAGCLRRTTATTLLWLDSDAVFVGAVDEAAVVAALGGRDLAMAEQRTITGTGWSRRELCDHFTTHSLPFLLPGSPLPPCETFRFYNSGVVLGTRSGMSQAVDWAISTMARRDPAHVVGRHTIADQDYLQVWTNIVRPDSCSTLSWHWNHCEYWDEPFPRAGVLIAHFSNFCFGPGRRQRLRMWALRRAAWRNGRVTGVWGAIARHNPWNR